MTTTRSTLTPLQHVVQNVLGLSNAQQQQLTAALQADDRVGIVDLLDLSPQALGGLRCPVTTGGTTREEALTSCITHQVTAFQSCTIWLKRNGQHPQRDDDKWRELTEDGFVDYRMSDTFMTLNNRWNTPSSSTSPSLTSPSTGSGSGYVRDPVAEFKRGVKRDPTLFTVMSQDKQWDMTPWDHKHSQNQSLCWRK